MNDKYLLDTNILVYAFDKQEPQKRAIAKEYLNHLFVPGERYMLSFQVVNEFCNVAQKKLDPPISFTNLQAFIQLIPDDRIVPLEKQTTLEALHIQHTHKLSFWDSLIVAAASLDGCKYLVTEDLSDSQVVDRVTIMNPFKHIS